MFDHLGESAFFVFFILLKTKADGRNKKIYIHGVIPTVWTSPIVNNIILKDKSNEEKQNTYIFFWSDEEGRMDI